MKLFIRIVLGVILLAGLAAIPLTSQAQFFVMENPLLNNKAPEFTLTNAKGDKSSLKDIRNNQPSIVFFWATWCPHCREQLKELNQSKTEIEKKGIKVILIDVGENANQVNQYITKNKVQYDVWLDQDSQVGQDYGVVGVPSFFFLNKDGIVKAVEHFLPDEYEKILMEK